MEADPRVRVYGVGVSRLVVDFATEVPFLGTRPSVERHWEIYAECRADSFQPGRVSRPPFLAEVERVTLDDDGIRVYFPKGAEGRVPMAQILSYYTEPLS